MSGQANEKDICEISERSGHCFQLLFLFKKDKNFPFQVSQVGMVPVYFATVYLCVYFSSRSV